MARGDHLRARRMGYWHHGIDCGDGTVIHYTGDLFHRKDASVRRTSREEFAKGARILKVRYAGCSDPDTVMQRAESRLDETDYDFFHNNCEHFARWCKTGDPRSKQVERLIRVTAATLAGAITLAGVVVARAVQSRSKRMPGT